MDPRRAIVVGAATALTLSGIRRSGALEAALLGTAAGILFDLVSALTKGAVEILQDDGIGGMLSDWHVYALLALGFAGMTLTQMALGTGVLPPAVATTSIFNPALSVVLGLTLFDESVHDTAVGSIAALLALLAMFGGVAVLALGQRKPGAGEEPRG